MKNVAVLYVDDYSNESYKGTPRESDDDILRVTPVTLHDSDSRLRPCTVYSANDLRQLKRHHLSVLTESDFIDMDLSPEPSSEPSSDASSEPSSDSLSDSSSDSSSLFDEEEFIEIDLSYTVLAFPS